MTLTTPEPLIPEDLDEFASRLKLNFKDKSLLLRALTHRSYINENPDAIEDNERLEFLGDAVLDYLVADWLYHRFPEMREGRLTRLRALLVDTVQLAGYARQLEIGKAMRLGRGEDENGGRNRDSLLCGTFEAIIGALSLDGGLPAVQEFLAPLLTSSVEALQRQNDKDAKSRLQEWSQSRGLGIPTYLVAQTSGPDHARWYIVQVYIDGEKFSEGEGPSKQKASMVAALRAIEALGVDI